MNPTAIVIDVKFDVSSGRYSATSDDIPGFFADGDSLQEIDLHLRLDVPQLMKEIKSMRVKLGRDAEYVIETGR